MVLCAKRGKETCTLYEQKSPVCKKKLRTYAGIGDAETQSPGMFRKPGDFPQVCPRPKKFKRLAMRDTQHGSRPNLQQREPGGRIVPTPPDVWDKGASTKRCARRTKKITILHVHMYKIENTYVQNRKHSTQHGTAPHRTTRQGTAPHSAALATLLS